MNSNHSGRILFKRLLSPLCLVGQLRDKCPAFCPVPRRCFLYPPPPPSGSVGGVLPKQPPPPPSFQSHTHARKEGERVPNPVTEGKECPQRSFRSRFSSGSTRATHVMSTTTTIPRGRFGPDKGLAELRPSVGIPSPALKTTSCHAGKMGRG